MSKGIFIVGTDTDVGKTVVSAGVIYLLKSHGLNVTYFKGALSGARKEGENLIPGDTAFVEKISGLKESYEDITPYIFEIPVSPHLASIIENKPINIEVIKKKYLKLREKYEYIICEGAGGLMVPLKMDYENPEKSYMIYNLIKDLELDVILVSKAGLGSINHTLLSLKVLKEFNIKIKALIINNFDENNLCHRDNLRVIEAFSKIDNLWVIPEMENIKVDDLEFSNLRECFEENIPFEKLIEVIN